ncbi:phage major capsid protein [Mycolicibacterium fluoranthenivorans]|nr:phage major capsid protein [Mycolicibacterium fluoranthenivorans]
MAEGETRSLTDEEVTEYETLEGQLKAAQKTQELRSRTAAYVAPNASLAAGVHVASPKVDNTLDQAFEALVRSGHANADVTELRAQGSTGSAGGYTIPETMRNTITNRLKAFGGVANAVETITTGTGEPIRWPTIDDTANSGVIAAEGAAPASGGADLVFGEKTLGAFKYTAPGASQLPLRVSLELLRDSATNIEDLVFSKLSERIARKQATDFVNGAGTTLPFGIATGTAVATNTFDNAAPTYADLLSVVHQIDPAYRDGASWTFNDYTLSLIEGIVDLNGRPLLNNAADGINVGRSNQYLLGYPVVIDQAWANYADAGTNKFGAFGNLKAGYIIRRVQDLTLIVNPYSRANEGQVEYTLQAWADGTVQDSYAFRVLQNEVS